MNIYDVVGELEGQFGGFMLSGVEVAPKDIDIYIQKDQLLKAGVYLKSSGFIPMIETSKQGVYLKYIAGLLYMIDLVSDFSVYSSGTYPLLPSEKGNEILGTNALLHKCYKYLVYRREDKIEFILNNMSILEAFLLNKSNFSVTNSNMIAEVLRSEDSLRAVMGARKFHTALKYGGSYKYVSAALTFYRKKFLSGKSIAFIGPDGSGKTFFLEKLKYSGDTQGMYMGDWFFKFQNFYNKILSLPLPYNRVVYFFYIIENVFRSLFVVSLKVRGKIVLIDRFPGTNRNSVLDGGLGFINRAIYRFFPKPDLLVMLDARPDVVYSRKQELSEAQIDRLQIKLKKIIKNDKHLILNTEKLDESLNSILRFQYQK